MPLKTLGHKIAQLFSKSTPQFFEELEDALIEADLGGGISSSIVAALRKQLGSTTSREALHESLWLFLSSMLSAESLPVPTKGELLLLFFFGVNGTGKTTTAAKLGHYYAKNYCSKILFAAGDTFRAAAVEQLQTHAQALGQRIIYKESGADPAAVLYDSIISARAHQDDIIIADTAGRMHNRGDLMRELQKMTRIVEKQHVLHHKILILDATTGQNALRQAEVFHQDIGVDKIILTKCDSVGRGGILFPIMKNLGISCVAQGTGEGREDFELFDKDIFVRKLLQ